MSEDRRVYRCLVCNTTSYPVGGPIPEACSSCGARWREPAVAIVERELPPFQTPDGASIIRSE